MIRRAFRLSFALLATAAALLLLNNHSLADSPTAEAPRELSIGLGNFGPYFIKHKRGGLFTELISEVFTQLPQYRIRYQFDLSNYRLINQLNQGRLDGAANVIQAEDISGCVSKPFFRFTDVAVSLKSRHYDIGRLQDLQTLSIVTYQGATSFWGSKLQKIADTNPNYSEIPKQLTQAKLIASGRKDVSIGDMYIFLYTLKIWGEENVQPADFDFHFLFPQQYTYMGFNEQQLCDDFNRGFEIIRQSGRYEELYQHYLKDLGYQSHSLESSARTP